MGWWQFAVRGFALLTTPRAEVARCDRDVEALARDSAIGDLLHTMSLVIRRARTGSDTRSAIRRLFAAFAAYDHVDAWRVKGWILVVVGATALILNPLATHDAGPLIWVTPALLVVAGLFAMAFAAPLARAAADRRQRSESSTK